MKLLGAKLRGIFAKFSEALPPSFAKATEGSPRLQPRSKLRGIRRRRIKARRVDFTAMPTAKSRRVVWLRNRPGVSAISLSYKNEISCDRCGHTASVGVGRLLEKVGLHRDRDAATSFGWKKI